MKLDDNSRSYIEKCIHIYRQKIFVLGSYEINESLLFGYSIHYPPFGDDFKIRFRITMKF